MIWTLSYLNMLHLLCSNIHCDPDHYSPAVPPHLPPSILFLLLCCGYFLFWTSHGTYLINLLSFKTHVHKFPCIIFQTMKNVRCKKLLIDRSKAPGKVGTLKDISLFGNFKFPSDGPYKGGIIAISRWCWESAQQNKSPGPDNCSEKCANSRGYRCFNNR